MSETAGEKSFAPTDKRKRDAARKGDVLRSREITTAAAILFGGAWLMFGGPWLLEEMTGIVRDALVFDRGEMIDFQPGQMMLTGLLAALPPILTIAGPMILIALVTQLGPSADGRWVNENLNFKGSRINPLSGLKRMFGPNGWIEMGKGILKVALLGAIAWLWARNWLDTIVGLGGGNLSQQLSAAWGAVISLLLALGGGLVVIALVDAPIQWVRRNQRLKMSHQEMRDEHKEAEGSPEARAHRRQRQREIAAGGVAHAMREAQFVLTNPTHFAVAMVYDPDKAAAPLVLAKGRGDKAQAMKELAREYGVPMLEYPQLARSVYFTTRENQTIREELYAALAAVLAFVFSLKRGEERPAPAIEVPVELRFDAQGRRAP
ncbi:EscU/YscU/HrcU family type III secretion system export apparatus switch protein [Pelagerythrobacter marinus]|uniref:EscU/YscU/HrcU family type III secretion system export apparatus switch protein n=1 Tax=Pelagerythrobacter marinus TaxID=538382 RepID=UPI002036A4BB|nr:EscU/YscU/HrcU family type III secretion system export apparatus switch protein [Pelagerythrobacter marinus]USA39734.1 EscU/YscU/HrcU family type III secretion system export apparatus switch protein [Pelagerythrobacter marinus]WPZ06135.1 EscU/YscU/HrcU family type III secretion system export apparatus switch protein [Pelagerythrobacter marinus]